MAKTSESRPETPPPDIKCLTLSSTSVKVVWNSLPTHKANGILTGYRVSLTLVGSRTLPRSLDVAADSGQAVVLNLDKFANYSVHVSGMTAVGEGPVNREGVFCRTKEDIASPVTSIKVAHAAPDTVIVSWMQPEFPNGIIKTYTLHRRSATDAKAATFTLPSHVRYYKASGLQTGLQHSFWVTSTNEAGESEPSIVVTTSMADSGTCYFASIFLALMPLILRGMTCVMICLVILTHLFSRCFLILFDSRLQPQQELSISGRDLRSAKEKVSNFHVKQ